MGLLVFEPVGAEDGESVDVGASVVVEVGFAEDAFDAESELEVELHDGVVEVEDVAVEFLEF